MTPTAAPVPAPSIKGAPQKITAPPVPAPAAPPALKVGDIVVVHVDDGIVRPLIVTHLTLAHGAEARVSGTIFCEPEDHTRPAFRGWSPGQTDPARIHGHPDRLTPFAYGELLAPGPGLGQWRRM